MILVTGASGHLGSAILDHLHRLGAITIAGTRNPTPGQRHIDSDGPDTLDVAGVSVLVLVSAGAAEDDVVIARHDAAITAAERDGVRHIVYTSLIGDGDHLTLAVAHRWTERRVQRSPVAHTILRNTLYAELLGAMLRPDASGVVTAPLGEGRVAVAARTDLAEAAARVAVAPDAHVGRTYELTGDTALSASDLAEQMNADYRPSTLAALREDLTAGGVPGFRAAHTVSIHSNIAAGFLAPVHDHLPMLLGHPLTDASGIAAQHETPAKNRAARSPQTT